MKDFFFNLLSIVLAFIVGFTVRGSMSTTPLEKARATSLGGIFSNVKIRKK